MEYKFSIITVVLNGEKTVEKTILSVIGQNYRNFEYLIIDGDSTDKTIEIIKRYEKSITLWISERDSGIYDAMNKGLSKCTGEIVLFLNADDYFAGTNILTIINAAFNQFPTVQLVYGKIIWEFFDPDYTIVYSGHLSLKGLKTGKMIPQASTFMKKAVFDKIGFFETNFQISGDFDLFCRFIKAKLEFKAVDCIVSHFRSGGKSENHKIAWQEGSLILFKHFGRYYAFRFAFIKKSELLVKNLLIALNLYKPFRRIRKKLIFAGKGKPK